MKYLGNIVLGNPLRFSLFGLTIHQASKRNPLPACLLPMLFLAFSTLPLRSDVIYTSFGPGQSFSNLEVGIGGIDTSGHYYQAMADSFQPIETVALSSIKVPLAYHSGANSFIIRVALDNAGAPGAVLESFTVGNVPEYPGAIQTVNSTLTPLLLNNTTYWLEVLPGDSTTGGGWFSRDPFPNYGNDYVAANHGDGWTISSIGTGIGTGPQAFEIDGTVIPEPGVASLLLGGIALLQVRRARRLS